MIAPETKPMISRYRLRAAGFLNAVSKRRDFEGALIRIGEGFGCIHPWPELGDPSLEQCLADLAGAQRRAIVRRAIRCARFDAAGRQFERSLFEELEIPISHATLPDLSTSHVAAAAEAGFSVLKAKMGRELEAETKSLLDLHAAFPAMKWRLDFNEVPEPDEARSWLLTLPESFRAVLDFVEDPCPYAASVWTPLAEETGVDFAVDREAAPDSAAAKVVVIKPALDEPDLLGDAALKRGQRCVFTSYMDHPFGQAFAAWEAARFAYRNPGANDVCGLQTHHLFEPNEFSEWLGPWQPTFQPPAGFGLGFDELLDALPWTRLY